MRTLLPAALALAAVLPAPAAAAGVSGTGDVRAGGERPGYVPGELIVKFRPGVTAGARADALRARSADLERSLPLPGTVLVRTRPGESATRAVRWLEADPRVAWAEPNAYRYGGAIPDDSFFDEQWGLHNTGQPVDGEERS